MKATTLDAVDLIYSSLKGKVSASGGIYKFRRPTDSDKEDVVINALPLTHNRHQKGTCNVNIYVQNLKTSNGDMPDFKRLKILSSEVTGLLDNQFGDYYSFYIESTQIIEHDEEFYQNIRIKVNIFKN